MMDAPLLQVVDVGPRDLGAYETVAGFQAVETIRQLAKPLARARVAHINATPYGGGVSELLRSLVPLYRALDISTDWLVMSGNDEFFGVTKAFHNALQGARFELTEEHKRTYLERSELVARALGPDYDFVIVHDPQPAALRKLRGRNGARWVWRCHIDTSTPDASVLAFLLPLLESYDALVFTMEDFVPAELLGQRIAIIPPGIDPLSPKNMAVPRDVLKQILTWSGIHLDRPLITQISRFDPWKDPLGVIDVYRRITAEVPGTQLALLGQMALDDPEGWQMYAQIVGEVSGDADIHVLTNFTGIGNMEVNAFQSISNVVLQKSIREGFGLVVSETLWKGTALVSGRAGGIPIQMPDGTGGCLVESADDCVEKTVHLLRNPAEAEALALLGRAHVREHFLITRLLADELKLLHSLSSS
jgi:trehalose synthase